MPFLYFSNKYRCKYSSLCLKDISILIVWCIPGGNWFTLKVEVLSGQATVYLDGNVLCTVIPHTQNTLSGFYGGVLVPNGYTNTGSIQTE